MMLHYCENIPDNAFRISHGILKVQNSNRVVAKLLLQIPQGEFINREVISRVVLETMAHPEYNNIYNLDEIYYWLGDPVEDVDFGIVNVPVSIYVFPR